MTEIIDFQFYKNLKDSATIREIFYSYVHPRSTDELNFNPQEKEELEYGCFHNTKKPPAE